MRKIKFIINPAAGHGESKESINLIHDKMKESQIDYSISISGFKGDIENISSDAASNGYTDVVAVGGDGTVLEAFNGIVDKNINLGIIPAGTGNDFGRMFDMNNDYSNAIDKIIIGKTKKIDIGVVNNTHFLNVVGMGIDGDIVKKTEKVRKVLKGPSAYLYSTFSTLINYKCKHIRLEIDGEIYNRKVYLVAIGNGKYFGGGMMVTPGAYLDSENFEIVIINEMKKVKFAILFKKVFTGKHVSENPVEVFNGKKIKITSDETIMINADGNIIGDSKAEIHILPKSQNIIV